MSDFECNYLKDLICIYPRGELTLEVMAKIFTAVEKKENEDGRSYNRFADFGGVSSFDLTSDDLILLGMKRQDYYKETYEKKVKLALFAPDNISYGIARTVQSLVESDAVEIVIFRSYEQAAEWLQVQLDDLKWPSGE